MHNDREHHADLQSPGQQVRGKDNQRRTARSKAKRRVSMKSTMEKALEIGIEKMETVKDMTTVLRIAKNKEDFLYVMKEMQRELKEGIAAIDQIETGKN